MTANSPTRMSPLTFHFWVSQLGWQLWFMKRLIFPRGPASITLQQWKTGEYNISNIKFKHFTASIWYQYLTGRCIVFIHEKAFDREPTRFSFSISLILPWFPPDITGNFPDVFCIHHWKLHYQLYMNHVLGDKCFSKYIKHCINDVLSFWYSCS